MTNQKIIISNRLSALKTLDRRLKKLNAERKRKYFILTDENVLEHGLPTLVYNVQELENAEFLELPAGEACKDIEIVNEVWKSLVVSNADRDSIIVNMGGGCVCDTGGFIAATYKRGISYINIPTTLTAMVDAAIGGKTAINLDNTKNQVGCFHLPILTCIEPAFLESLPNKELRSGEYEIMKILLLTNYENWNKVFIKERSYNELISYCVNFKRAVVKADPHEQSIRKMLNFGHTFGHAIESYETACGRTISHGEAVGIGMLYAIYLSTKKVGLEKECLSLYKTWLKNRRNLPKYSLKDIEEIIQYMYRDKKTHDSEIRCVLLKKLGVPIIDIPVSENEIRDTILSQQ